VTGLAVTVRVKVTAVPPCRVAVAVWKVMTPSPELYDGAVTVVDPHPVAGTMAGDDGIPVAKPCRVVVMTDPGAKFDDSVKPTVNDVVTAPGV